MSLSLRPRASSWKPRKQLVRNWSLGKEVVLQAVLGEPGADPLGVGVVQPVDEVGDPGKLVFNGADLDLWDSGPERR